MSSRGSGIHVQASNIETIEENSISNQHEQSSTSSPVHIRETTKDYSKFEKQLTEARMIKSLGSSATKKTGETKHKSAAKQVTNEANSHE